MINILSYIDAKEFGALCEKVNLIHQMLSNHLHHHFVFNMALITAVLGLVTALIIMIVKMKNRPEDIGDEND